MKKLVSTLTGLYMLAATVPALASERVDFVKNMPVVYQDAEVRKLEKRVNAPYEDETSEEGVSPATIYVSLTDLPPFDNLGPEDTLNVRVYRGPGEVLFDFKDKGWDSINNRRTDYIRDYTRMTGVDAWSVKPDSSLERKEEGAELVKKILNLAVKYSK